MQGIVPVELEWEVAMSEQHEQQASPGYVGPQGIPDRSSGDDEEKGVLQRLKDDITGEADRDAAEDQPESVGEGIGLHERQDIGMTTADVRGDPYGGSAGSRALDLAADQDGSADDTAP